MGPPSWWGFRRVRVRPLARSPACDGPAEPTYRWHRPRRVGSIVTGGGCDAPACGARWVRVLSASFFWRWCAAGASLGFSVPSNLPGWRPAGRLASGVHDEWATGTADATSLWGDSSHPRGLYRPLPPMRQGVWTGPSTSSPLGRWFTRDGESNFTCRCLLARPRLCDSTSQAYNPHVRCPMDDGRLGSSREPGARTRVVDVRRGPVGARGVLCLFVVGIVPNMFWYIMGFAPFSCNPSRSSITHALSALVDYRHGALLRHVVQEPRVGVTRTTRAGYPRSVSLTLSMCCCM